MNNYSKNEGEMPLMSFPAGVTGNQKPTTFQQGNKRDSGVLETRSGFDVWKSLCSYVPVRLVCNFPAGKIRYLPAQLYALWSEKFWIHLILKTHASVTEEF